MSDSGLPHVHVVGDSISMRYGPDLAQMLAGIADYSRKPVVGDDPESANARDSGTALAYLVGLDAAERAGIDTLLVNCGLHDIKRDLDDGAPLTPPAEYAERLRAIASYAREGGHTLVWVRTTPVVDAIHNGYPGMQFHRYAADVAAYNEAADAVMLRPALLSSTCSASPGASARASTAITFTSRRRSTRLQAAYIAGNLSQIIT